MKENNKVTELDIFKAIYFKYNTKAFNAVCPHVSIGTMWGVGKDESVRRIDALVMEKTGKTTCFEIKVLRQDFLNDVNNPDKQELWREHSDFFYYVVPIDMVEYCKDKLPKGFGLMSYSFEYAWPDLWVVKRSTRNKEKKPLPDQVMYRVLKQAGNYYSQLKGKIEI